MMGDYLSVGAYLFDASEIMAEMDIDKLDLRDQTTADVLMFQNDLMIGILEKYLKDFSANMKFDFISQNCGGNVEKWHSDAGYVMAKQNTTINCFFDDTSEELGGCFDICLFREGLVGTKDDVEDMSRFYPKKHSILIFNQNRNYLHKAVPSKNQRRMVSFATEFEDFNHLHRNLVAC